jgi:hypothetical protein
MVAETGDKVAIRCPYSRANAASASAKVVRCRLQARAARSPRFLTVRTIATGTGIGAFSHGWPALTPLVGQVEVGWLGPMLAQGFLDALRVRGSDALAGSERLPQAGGAFAKVAVVEVAVAYAFQGAGLLEGCADLGCDGERLAVVVAGLAGG